MKASHTPYSLPRALPLSLSLCQDQADRWSWVSAEAAATAPTEGRHALLRGVENVLLSSSVPQTQKCDKEQLYLKGVLGDGTSVAT